MSDYSDYSSEDVQEESIEEVEREDSEEENSESDFDIEDITSSVEVNIIRPENRKTRDMLTEYEMTELVSIRTEQIGQYNNCMIDTTGLTTARDMARYELMARKCPLQVRRVVGEINGKQYIEIWDPNQMVFAKTY